MKFQEMKQDLEKLGIQVGDFIYYNNPTTKFVISDILKVDI